jgi:hypothetical protein
MARHLVCFTIDTDPDGVTAQTMNRRTLVWRGLETIQPLLDRVEGLRAEWGALPITWFIRADAQIREAFGSALHLLEAFEPLWAETRAAGHELGWHPHLYRASGQGKEAVLIADPQEAADEIAKLWSELAGSSFAAASAFRNGEGWHYRETFRAVERLGFRWDSTAIPGRQGAAWHPMDWTGTPNRPYFPGEDIRLPGRPRPLLEIPLNTWHVQAPYDPHPRLRYLDPAVHEVLFRKALETLELNAAGDLQVWTLVLHPDEILQEAPPDLLYGRSAETLCRNLDAFATALRRAGNTVEFVTISQAGREWLGVREEMIV